MRRSGASGGIGIASPQCVAIHAVYSLALGLAVVLAGTLTAWFAARAAAGRDAVLAFKDDW